MKIQTERLAHVSRGQWAGLTPPACVTHGCIDSRLCQKGDVFIALQGARCDGHAYLGEAQRRGASMAIVSHFQSDVALPQLIVKDTYAVLLTMAAMIREDHPRPLVAITGSCGKTSTRAMCEAIMAEHGDVLASQASFNNHVGVPLTLFRLTEAHRFIVQEVGANHPGEIAQMVAWLKPDVAVITNAAPCHLEGFGSLKGVATAKGEILQGPGIAVLPVDDPFFGYWAQRALTEGRKILPFGLGEKALIRASDTVSTPEGTHFTLHTPKGQVHIALSVVGAFHVLNALAAVAVAHAWDVPLPTIQKGLASFRAVRSRMNVHKGVHGACLIDDAYNANPHAMEAALQVLLSQPGDPIMVMGDMLELGDKTQAYHAAFGEHCRQQGLKKLYCFGEYSHATAKAFGRGAHHFLQRDDLVHAVRSQCQKNTVLLVKGSHSMGMQHVVDALRLDTMETPS